MITIQHLYKSFGTKTVLQDLNLTLPNGQITGLMAPSGFGKTTLLRILLGLEKADSGKILTSRPLRFSAVFQQDCLCPWLGVVQNIRLVAPHVSAQEIEHALHAVGIQDMHSPVQNFSGGMARRVAILRAMFAPSDAILMDEPCRGLDFDTKSKTLHQIASMCRDKTVLFCTHDVRELDALAVSSRYLFP